MKLKTLNKIRTIAKKRICKSKAPRNIINYRIDFIMWEIIQKLKPNHNS